MKKIFNYLLLIGLIVCLCGCEKKIDNTSNEEINLYIEEDKIISSSKTWPSDVYPKPKNCKILETDVTERGTVVFVKWDDIEAAKSYATILKNANEEVIIEIDEDNDYLFANNNIAVTYSEEETSYISFP